MRGFPRDRACTTTTRWNRGNAGSPQWTTELVIHVELRRVLVVVSIHARPDGLQRRTPQQGYAVASCIQGHLPIREKSPMCRRNLQPCLLMRALYRNLPCQEGAPAVTLLRPLWSRKSRLHRRAMTATSSASLRRSQRRSLMKTTTIVQADLVRHELLDHSLEYATSPWAKLSRIGQTSTLHHR